MFSPRPTHPYNIHHLQFQLPGRCPIYDPDLFYLYLLLYGIIVSTLKLYKRIDDNHREAAVSNEN